MKRAPRLLCTALFAFALGAAAGARADGELASLEPAAPSAESTATQHRTLQAVLWSEARHLGSELRQSVGSAIARAERDHGIPALLIVSLIVQESGFDPMAENAGALGLLQLRPFVAKDYAARRGLRWSGDTTLLDPVRNIQLATGYLGELIARFGSLDLALEAYNKGPEYVKRQLRESGDATPTARFVKSVIGRYEWYNARYSGF
jgi:soluble lytic murein transglycosylase